MNPLDEFEALGHLGHDFLLQRKIDSIRITQHASECLVNPCQRAGKSIASSPIEAGDCWWKIANYQNTLVAKNANNFIKYRFLIRQMPPDAQRYNALQTTIGKGQAFGFGLQNCQAFFLLSEYTEGLERHIKANHIESAVYK